MLTIKECDERERSSVLVCQYENLDRHVLCNETEKRMSERLGGFRLNCRRNETLSSVKTLFCESDHEDLKEEYDFTKLYNYFC